VVGLFANAVRFGRILSSRGCPGAARSPLNPQKEYNLLHSNLKRLSEAGVDLQISYLAHLN
jgi:hypothetical protein